jgi:hypothetical protein
MNESIVAKILEEQSLFIRAAFSITRYLKN